MGPGKFSGEWMSLKKAVYMLDVGRLEDVFHVKEINSSTTFLFFCVTI